VESLDDLFDGDLPYTGKYSGLLGFVSNLPKIGTSTYCRYHFYISILSPEEFYESMVGGVNEGTFYF
jgi:hypothetical protein